MTIFAKRPLSVSASLIAALWICSSLEAAFAQTSSSKENLAATMLTGTIRAANGKPMEGVTVSGRDVEKTFTTIVYTDAKGKFVFPSMDRGRYRVWAQAVGYETTRAEVNLDPSKETHEDFKLRTLEGFFPN